MFKQDCRLHLCIAGCSGEDLMLEMDRETNEFGFLQDMRESHRFPAGSVGSCKADMCAL